MVAMLYDWLRVNLPKHEGKILSMMASICSRANPDTAEIRVARLAIKTAKDQGWHSNLVEGDSSNAINLIKGSLRPAWNSKVIVQDCRSFLSCFQDWQCSKVSRKVNQCAHALAKWAASVRCNGSLPEGSIPWDIRNMLGLF